MQTLPARMKYLRNTELLSGLVLPAVLCYTWQNAAEPVQWEMRGAALLVVSHILFQGALYWQLKLQTVVRRTAFPPWFQPLYRCFKYSNLLLIAAVAVLIGMPNETAPSAADLAWTCGLLAFAALEQINYYHVQLMYDTGAALAHLRRNGRLRKAALRIDLERRVAP